MKFKDRKAEKQAKEEQESHREEYIHNIRNELIRQQLDHIVKTRFYKDMQESKYKRR